MIAEFSLLRAYDVQPLNHWLLGNYLSSEMINYRTSAALDGGYLYSEDAAELSTSERSSLAAELCPSPEII